MKKFLSISLLLVISFLLTACGNKNQVSGTINKQGKHSTENKEFENDVEKTISEWIKNGDAVECKIKNVDGEIIMKAKDEKIRIEGVPYVDIDSVQAGDKDIVDNMDGIIITNGDWTYTWSTKSKKGTKMNIKEMEKARKDFGDMMNEDDQGYEDSDEIIADWDNDENIEYDCKKVKLNDSLFEEPSGIEFVDMGKTMKGLSEMGNNLNKQIEAGNSLSESDIKALKDMLPKGVELPEDIEHLQD